MRYTGSVDEFAFNESRQVSVNKARDLNGNSWHAGDV
jgi:hypothetical protein